MYATSSRSLPARWYLREKKLAQAYSMAAKQHHALKITKPLPTKASNYFGRPYLVIHGENFANEIKKAIKDVAVKELKQRLAQSISLPIALT